MLKSRIHKFAVAAATIASAVGLATLGVVATGAASASTHGSASVSTVAAGSSASSCAAIGYVYEEQIKENVVFCGPGYYYRPSGGWTVGAVYPYTNNRWWLHENGGAYCIRGKDFLYGVPAAYQDPANILVSTNTAAC